MANTEWWQRGPIDGVPVALQPVAHILLQVRESVDELTAGLASGEVAEVFACGTAAVMTPIGRLASDDFDLTVGDGGAGPVTVAIREQLTDIQTGRATDTHGWLYRLV